MMGKLGTSLDADTAKGNDALQRDLFTGEWQAKPPKRGSGSHVRLKAFEGEKPVVAGMAAFAGEGPVGKYCKDCGHFGEVAVQRTPDAIEMNPTGCAIYSRRMGRAAPIARRNIKLCAACKHFVAADEAIRRFIVDQAGAVHQVENFPEDLRRWRPSEDTPIAPADAALSTPDQCNEPSGERITKDE
jgi:hypothetical protein